MVNTIIYLLVNSSDPDQYTNFMTNQTLAMGILQNVFSHPKEVLNKKNPRFEPWVFKFLLKSTLDDYYLGVFASQYCNPTFNCSIALL